jgi:hypothetical protein
MDRTGYLRAYTYVFLFTFNHYALGYEELKRDLCHSYVLVHYSLNEGGDTEANVLGLSLHF